MAFTLPLTINGEAQAAAYVKATIARSLWLLPYLAVVLPYVAFGTASGSGFGSFLNVGHHVLEVAIGGGFIQEFTILAHKNAGTYTLKASEQTKITPAASSVFLNLTTTFVNNRLNMVLGLNAPYNSNSAYIIAKLTSYYNIDF